MSGWRASAGFGAAWAGVVWACLVVGGLAGGCGSTTPRVVSPPRPVEPEGARVMGAEAGLEVQWWVVNRRPSRVEFATEEEAEADPSAPPDALQPAEPNPEPPGLRATVVLGESVGEVLAPYLDRPVPLSEEERERWRLNGLRIVSVPPEDLAMVRARLSIAGPLHAQWLGEPPDWTVIAAGPRAPGGLVLRADEGEVALGPGRLRLLARCWSVPLAGSEAAAGLRLEVAPQHEETLGEEESLELAAGLRPSRSTEEAGRVFARLALEATVTEDTALLVVPAPPEEGWGDAVATAGVSEGGAQGPPVFLPPTLGQAMLTAGGRGGGEGGGRARAVVVLMLRVPARFELLAGPGGGEVR